MPRNSLILEGFTSPNPTLIIEGFADKIQPAGNEYIYLASGIVNLDGLFQTILYNKHFISTSEGIITIDGDFDTSLYSKNYITTFSGGLILDGYASSALDIFYSGNGNIVINGISQTSQGISFIGNGNIDLDGIADYILFNKYFIGQANGIINASGQAVCNLYLFYNGNGTISIYGSIPNPEIILEYLANGTILIDGNSIYSIILSPYISGEILVSGAFDYYIHDLHFITEANGIIIVNGKPFYAYSPWLEEQERIEEEEFNYFDKFKSPDFYDPIRGGRGSLIVEPQNYQEIYERNKIVASSAIDLSQQPLPKSAYSSKKKIIGTPTFEGKALTKMEYASRKEIQGTPRLTQKNIDKEKYKTRKNIRGTKPDTENSVNYKDDIFK